MEKRAQAIANSVLLIAINRLLLPVATPIVVAAILWLGTTTLQLDRSLAVQQADLSRLSSELGDLKRARETDEQLARKVQQDLAGIREAVTGQRRSLDRIEQFIDRQTHRP
jgi:hypothetical protein